MLRRKPTEVLRKAIMGMLTRNKLRHQYLEPRLKIYPGPDHPHNAQLPKDVEPLPSHPRSLNGTFHYGLKRYAPLGVTLQGIKK